MDLYDFDNTIYDGNCTIDFFFFCFRKKKTLARYLPLAANAIVLHEVGLLSIDEVFDVASKIISAFIRNFNDIEAVVRDFWQLNAWKLKPGFMSRIGSDDIITTASPSFLIDGITHMLPTEHIICSEFDMEKGVFIHINFRENKVMSLEKKYPGVRINNFYTDSFNDRSLMGLAGNTYLVKGNQITLHSQAKSIRYRTLFDDLL